MQDNFLCFNPSNHQAPEQCPDWAPFSRGPTDIFTYHERFLPHYIRNIFILPDQNGATFVQTPAKAKPVRSLYEVAKFAPLDIELGNNEDYEVEVVTSSASQVPERRYDIADLGDPDLFQGWADVQGTGAANDYCR